MWSAVITEQCVGIVRFVMAVILTCGLPVPADVFRRYFTAPLTRIRKTLPAS